MLNLNTMEWQLKNYQDIKPGDILKIKKDQEVPTDMVLIAASNRHGLVYSDNAKLTGETDL